LTNRRNLIAGTAILTVLIAGISPAWSGQPSPADDYADCQTTIEADFRKAVFNITSSALGRNTASIDYLAAVKDEWRRLDVSRTLDAEVDRAFTAVKDEQSWGSLLESLGSENKARELTTVLTERVYRSDAMTKAIEDLANGVGRRIAGNIEIATSDAAAPAIRCMNAFLGPRYGSTVASVVTGAAGQEFQVSSETAAGGVTAGGVLNQTAGGVTGAAILVMRRQLGNMAGRLGTRLVGSVLSRLVTVAAGGVGLVLIAKDVWDLRYGVLPIIATELKSETSKASVQAELASSIAAQINEHVVEIANHASDRIVDIWKEYRAAHAMVLDLSEKQPDFRAFLDRVRPEALPRVDEVTALLLPAEGEAGVMRRLSDGTLDLAVNKLSEPAMEIARQTRSLEQGLAWSAVAGTRIDKVLEYELFRRAQPGDFTTGSLERVVALDDPVAIKRLAAIPPATRDLLFELDPKVLTAAARSLDEPQLTVLTSYLAGLSPQSRRLLLDRASQIAVLKSLTDPRIRDAVIASRDQEAALRIVLRPEDDDTVQDLQNDVRLAWERQIDARLLWYRHPILVALSALAIVILVLLIRRLFRSPGRPSAGGTGPDATHTAGQPSSPAVN
jgi:hypothetical protein